MAQDIHINIDTIPGESMIKGFEKQIQVQSFSWGLNQTAVFGASTGGGAGKVDVHNLTINHFVDTATPKLMLACASGQHIPKAVLTCSKAGGGSVVNYFKLTLTDILVTSVAPAGTGNDTPMESFSLSCAKFEVVYTGQDNAGKPTAPVTVGWDIQKNQKV